MRGNMYDPDYSVYISGPMRGLEDLNKGAFDAVARRGAARGWRVFNPSDENETLKSAPFSVCIRKDVEFLLKAKGIVLLPGWQASEGARFEAEVAKQFGLDFYEAVPLAGNHDYTIRQTSVPEIGAEGIDQEARRLVYGDRAATYGHPRGDFDRVAKMWGAILGTEITSEQVAIMMVAFKLARLSQTPTHHDSQVDTIGYMLCLARLQEDPAEIEAWNARAVAASKPQPIFPTLADVAEAERAAAAPKLPTEAEQVIIDGHVAPEREWAGAGFHTPYPDTNHRGGIIP